ncbi:MAG: hypothetical protein JNJ54_21340 [Myxococcaceae bacterium]|nr:hypothetical protein [Myxococcaceae bacterium]
MRLGAGLFAALFFGGLPLFWLATLEGPTRFECGGAPWRCEVSRWVLFHTEVTRSEPVRVEAQHRRRGKGKGFTEWRVVFLTQAGAAPATDWGGEDNERAALQLEAARSRAAPLTLARGAAPMFWFAVALSVLFVAIGLFIVFSTPSPASVSRGRPE